MSDAIPIFMGLGLSFGLIVTVVVSWRRTPRCSCGKRHAKRPESMTAPDFVEHFCGDDLKAMEMRARRYGK